MFNEVLFSSILQKTMGCKEFFTAIWAFLQNIWKIIFGKKDETLKNLIKGGKNNTINQ